MSTQEVLDSLEADRQRDFDAVFHRIVGDLVRSDRQVVGYGVTADYWVPALTQLALPAMASGPDLPGDYHLRAGLDGLRPPMSPWDAAATVRAEPIDQKEGLKVLTPRYAIAGAVQAGEIDGRVTVVHEDGKTFVATKLAELPEGAQVELPPIPLDAFVCDLSGSLAVADEAA